MVQTTLKIDGMMCSMCETHMNDLIRKNFNVKKVKSSASKGETIIISEEDIDIPMAEKEIENIGYKLLAYDTMPYVKRGLFGKR